ncbi:MAG: GIY-YIG nuclease family protein [Polyangia bacterium]
MRRVAWFVYLLRCGDDSLYCGMTNDVERRLEAHRRGVGARYTRGRSPLTLVHKVRAKDRGDALRKEAAWKRLSRAEKLAKIAKALRAQRARKKRAGLPTATV